MKKYILLSVLLAFFSFSEAVAQIGINAGYSMENIIYRTYGEPETDDINGFHLGLTYNIPLSAADWGGLSLMPGLIWNCFLENDYEDEARLVIKESMSEHYLDIPVNVRYAYDFIPDVLGIFAYAGPVFSFGISSSQQVSLKGEILGSKIDGSVKTDNYTGKVTTTGLDVASSAVYAPSGIPDYGRFNLKFGIGAGFRFFRSFDLRVGYDFGLLNRYKGEGTDIRMRTDVLHLGLAYHF